MVACVEGVFGWISLRESVLRSRISIVTIANVQAIRSGRHREAQNAIVQLLHFVLLLLLLALALWYGSKVSKTIRNIHSELNCRFTYLHLLEVAGRRNRRCRLAQVVGVRVAVAAQLALVLAAALQKLASVFGAVLGFACVCVFVNGGTKSR